jgi:hypothetical protein
MNRPKKNKWAIIDAIVDLELQMFSRLTPCR